MQQIPYVLPSLKLVVSGPLQEVCWILPWGVMVTDNMENVLSASCFWMNNNLGQACKCCQLFWFSRSWKSGFFKKMVNIPIFKHQHKKQTNKRKNEKLKENCVGQEKPIWQVYLSSINLFLLSWWTLEIDLGVLIPVCSWQVAYLLLLHFSRL